MPRYIDAEQAIHLIENDALSQVYYSKSDAIDCINATPTADVANVKHGEWMETQEPLGWRDVDCIECSVCHESWIMNEDSSIDDYECMWHHCPNCGAKMKGGEE